jgi:hypothetical protein
MKINGKEIEVRELTVGQVDRLLGEFDRTMNAPVEMCDLLFPDRAPVSVVILSTGLNIADINGMLPSEYETVLEAVETVNPYLMAGVRRLAEIGARLLPENNSAV